MTQTSRPILVRLRAEDMRQLRAIRQRYDKNGITLSDQDAIKLCIRRENLREEHLSGSKSH